MSLDRKIAIVGAGGFGREVHRLITEVGYIPVGFIDPDPPASGLPAPVLGDDLSMANLMSKGIASGVCIALGDMSKRRMLLELADQNGLNVPPIVHPSAVVLTDIPIAPGAIIYPNVVVMTNCHIGRGALLNSGVTLGHDVVIGECSNVQPGANLAGNICIG